MDNRPTTLQDYADEHCGGNRYRAIYELLFIAGENTLDPYVDEMSSDDATFTFMMMRLQSIRAYGSTENYQKALKAESLAEQLKVSIDDVRAGIENPFKKKLLTEFLKLLGAVLLPGLAALLLKSMGVGYDWIFGIQPILIGLAAMSVSGALISFSRFRKLKKLLTEFPKPAQLDTYPSFEECMDAYAELGNQGKTYASSTPEEANAAMDAARKTNIIALLMLPVFAIVIIAAIVGAIAGGVVGCIIGCAAIIAFFFWQMRRVWKATLRTRNTTSGIPVGNPGRKPAEKRQSLYGLALILLGGLYILAVFVGCMLCIAMLSA